MTASLINIVGMPEAASAAMPPAATGRRPSVPVGQGDAPAVRPFQAAMLAAANPNSDGLSGISVPADQVVVGLTPTNPLEIPPLIPGDAMLLAPVQDPVTGADAPTSLSAIVSGNPLPAAGNLMPPPVDATMIEPPATSAAESSHLAITANAADALEPTPAQRTVTPAELAIDTNARAPRPAAAPAVANTRLSAEPRVAADERADALPAVAADAEPAIDLETMSAGRSQRTVEFLTAQSEVSSAIRTQVAAAAGSAESPAAAFLQSSPAGNAPFDQLMQTSQLPTMRPLQPTADADVFTQGLGHRLMVMSEEGVQSARLKLHPENLGTLDIRIQVDDDTARVWFTAQHGQTREALEAAMPRLRDLFAEQGMQLVQADVESGRHDERAGGLFDQPEGPDFNGGEQDGDPAVDPLALNGYIGTRSLDIYV